MSDAVPESGPRVRTEYVATRLSVEVRAVCAAGMPADIDTLVAVQEALRALDVPGYRVLLVDVRPETVQRNGAPADGLTART